MGLEQRNHSVKTTNVPGPGTYSERTFVGEGPKINMGSRMSDVATKLVVPGPGSYSPSFNKLIKSPQSTGIGYGGRSSSIEKKNPVPGPGSYGFHSTIDEGPKFGFSKSQKMKEEKKVNVPGPGTYSNKNNIGELPYYEKSNLKVK